jgi:hypothetical protein
LAVEALASFYQRQGNDKALSHLLERAIKDSNRALQMGRFTPDLFGVLETISSLRGESEAAEVARLLRKVLEGEAPGVFPALGSPALSVDLDEHIAPELLGPGFRALLKQGAQFLEQAYAMDLKAMRCSPLAKQSASLAQAIENAAMTMGLGEIETYISPAIGPTCLPLGATPPRVIVGSALVESQEEPVRQFLILRALKIIQTRGAVLARTAPIDLVPLVAAFVKALAPSFEPRNVDARRFSTAFAEITKFVSGPDDPGLQQLALDIGGSINNRMSTLNVAVAGWGSRAAFLALGNLDAALTGIAWAGGHPSGLPEAGTKRVTWVRRHPEARDIIYFLSSKAYLQARTAIAAKQ